MLLQTTPGHYDSVVEFDHCSDDYEQAVKPFSQPVFDELLALLLPHLVPDARILDPSCGPGTEAIALARLVPEGEVVAADLSRGMVETSWRNARQAGLGNMAFVQADVGDPPAAFEGYFDAISCCLAFHHYPDGAAAIRAFRKVLKPGGMGLRRRPRAEVVQRHEPPLGQAGRPRLRAAPAPAPISRCSSARQASPTSTGSRALPGIGITVAST